LKREDPTRKGETKTPSSRVWCRREGRGSKKSWVRRGYLEKRPRRIIRAANRKDGEGLWDFWR